MTDRDRLSFASTGSRTHDVRGCGKPMDLMAVSDDGVHGWWCMTCNAVKWDEHPGQGSLFDAEPA